MPWFTCEVTRAGPAEDGSVFVGLRDVDGSFPSRWFVADASVHKEMLATALAAVTANKRVTTLLVDTAEYSAVSRLYLMA